MCCWVSALSLSSSFLSWFWCWWLLGLSVSSRKSLTLRQWLHPRRCGGRVWNVDSNPVLVIKPLHCLFVFWNTLLQRATCLAYINLGAVLTRNFIHNPFLLFSWCCVLHLHQHLSHFSEGFEDDLQLDETYAFAVFFLFFFFSIFSDTPFTYGRHNTCALLSSVSLSFPSLCPPCLSHLHSYQKNCLTVIT